MDEAVRLPIVHMDERIESVRHEYEIAKLTGDREPLLRAASLALAQQIINEGGVDAWLLAKRADISGLPEDLARYDNYRRSVLGHRDEVVEFPTSDQ